MAATRAGAGADPGSLGPPSPTVRQLRQPRPGNEHLGRDDGVADSAAGPPAVTAAMIRSSAQRGLVNVRFN